MVLDLYKVNRFRYTRNGLAGKIAISVMLIGLFFGFGRNASGQSDTLNIKRLYTVAGVHAVSYTGTMIGLGSVWYSNTAHTKFHWFNDNDEWLQMDKAGHMTSTYWMSGISAATFRWTGMNRKHAALLGAGTSFLYVSSVEIFDGLSSAWGASWGDILANATGSGLFLAQELLFDRQMLMLKFSYSASTMDKYRPELLGRTFAERLIKDYNAQTYWLSGSPFEAWKDSKCKWLQVSVGYGAAGMLGGTTNPSYNEDGDLLPILPRQRACYLSLDINWERIPTDKKGLKLLFAVLNHIKLPFPAVEWQGGVCRVRGIYF